jgi:hypothetical protein
LLLFEVYDAELLGTAEDAKPSDRSRWPTEADLCEGAIIIIII